MTAASASMLGRQSSYSNNAVKSGCGSELAGGAPRGELPLNDVTRACAPAPNGATDRLGLGVRGYVIGT